jgi:hypothetical protein
LAGKPEQERDFHRSGFAFSLRPLFLLKTFFEMVRKKGDLPETFSEIS